MMNNRSTPFTVLYLVQKLFNNKEGNTKEKGRQYLTLKRPFVTVSRQLMLCKGTKYRIITRIGLAVDKEIVSQ